MPYAALSDVQALISKFAVSATSRPTDDQAGEIIAQVSAEIDSVISAAGYAVPVATPSWFAGYLTLLNSYGAATLILKSMIPQSRPGSETGSSEYGLYHYKYSEGLKRLAGSGGIPPEAVTNSASVSPSTYYTRNPDAEEDLGDIAEPFFKRSHVF